jgi:hypothetical protein
LLEISAKRVLRKLDKRYWTSYIQGCRQSLHDVAAQESLKILVWSVNLNHESETISHHVALGEARWEISPLRIARALRPPQGYWTLDFLAQGLENGWQLQRQILKDAVEYQRLQRYDHQGASSESADAGAPTGGSPDGDRVADAHQPHR